MTQDGTSRPRWVVIAAVLGIAWYAFGLLQFWLAYSADTQALVAQATITQAYADALASIPGFVWVAFALASAAGLIGAALLLIGSSHAVAAFLVSLLSAVLYYIWLYGMGDMSAVLATSDTIISVAVLVVTVGFLALSRRMTRS